MAASTVDSFFGFLDKYHKEIALAVAGAFLLRAIKKATPDAAEVAAQQDEAKALDVNSRLVPPPAPKPSATAKQKEADAKKYNADVKAHRSAVHASELYHAMHRGKLGALDFFNLDGTDEDAILKTAYNVALARITLTQLKADYRAYADKFVDGTKPDLMTDLKSELSDADYRKFLRIVGLSVDAAAKEYKTSPYAKKK